MDNSKLELLNICTDLKRSVMFLVKSQDNDPKNCVFIQNILKNFPKLSKNNPQISKIIDINYINSNIDSANTKAEFLLMQSLKLQHYLGL
ncbi:MAG: hypothetical protein WCT51_03165 [Candidatus Shapirobacteria bacterium]|jgi:hypothetical protein